MCLSRDRGGLGIRKLSSLNKALLGKWCWRFGAEVEGLWKTIIRLKYGAEGGGWLIKAVRGNFGVGLWKLIHKESFSIKQHNNLILGDGFLPKRHSFQILLYRTCLFPKRLFWNKWVPSKMGFFAWEGWWGRALTMDQLKRRGFSLANRCPLCGKDEENIEHPLLHCPMVWGIWSFLLTSMGVAWVPLWLIKDWFFGLNSIPVRKSERKPWRAAPFSLFWAIWKERNRVLFENEEFSLNKLRSVFVYSFCSWVRVVVNSDSFVANLIALLATG